jgi:hypothetical protein
MESMGNREIGLLPSCSISDFESRMFLRDFEESIMGVIKDSHWKIKTPATIPGEVTAFADKHLRHDR